jgi:hypothetical protein
LYIVIGLGLHSQAQTSAVKEGKWGIKKDNRFIISPVYDTIFNFDESGKVCMACDKIKGGSANKFIKVTSVTYSCRYFNSEGERLSVTINGSDSISHFGLSKNSVQQYQNSFKHFVISYSNKKYLITKDFKQITFKGYKEIEIPIVGDLAIAQKSEDGTVLTGLINLKEEIIVPFAYSGIKISYYDSLIIACSNGLQAAAEDIIFDLKGKQLYSFKKHIHVATKQFIIFKVFEPKEQFIVSNIETSKEYVLEADDLQTKSTTEVLVKIKKDSFIYNLHSQQKTPINK